MLLKDVRERLVFFELIHLRNSFCYRIENSWGFRYKNFGSRRSLGEKPYLFVFLGITEISGFSELSVYNTEVLLLKTFLNNLDYAAIANIEEVMKFYNLGDKTLETDFSFICLYGIQTNTDLLQLYWQCSRFFFLNWIPCQSKEIQMSSHKHIHLSLLFSILLFKCLPIVLSITASCCKCSSQVCARSNWSDLNPSKSEWYYSVATPLSFSVLWDCFPKSSAGVNKFSVQPKHQKKIPQEISDATALIV